MRLSAPEIRDFGHLGATRSPDAWASHFLHGLLGHEPGAVRSASLDRVLQARSLRRLRLARPRRSGGGAEAGRLAARPGRPGTGLPAVAKHDGRGDRAPGGRGGGFGGRRLPAGVGRRGGGSGARPGGAAADPRRPRGRDGFSRDRGFVPGRRMAVVGEGRLGRRRRRRGRDMADPAPGDREERSRGDAEHLHAVPGLGVEGSAARPRRPPVHDRAPVQGASVRARLSRRNGPGRVPVVSGAPAGERGGGGGAAQLFRGDRPGAGRR